MPNLFPPQVTVFDSTVELGKKLSLANMFSVADIDPATTITKYRFRDNSSAATSGFFELNGVRLQSNVWIEINASQLTNVFYKAGLIISGESIGIEAFDGQFWSESSFGNVFSVVPNLRAPIVTATATSILSAEAFVVSNFVSATDPDGYPIQKYLFVDRSGGNSGYFLLNNVQLPSQAWFTINASELAFLRYVGGITPGPEGIGVQAFDGTSWSLIVNTNWTTTPNNFAPTVEAFDLNIPIDRVISADQLFKFTDVDGNTLKRVQFFDTGVLPTGGFFTVDGVVQAPNVWFEVSREQLGLVEYHTASVFDFERFRVRAFDGRFWSANASAKIVSVTPPDFIVPRVLVLDAFEERLVNTQISIAPGPAITKYEVIDLTAGSTTAQLLRGGVPLSANAVHELTPTQFASLEFMGGQDDNGREFDTFVIRGFNGVFWSDWTNIVVHTDAFVHRALDFGADWSTGGGTTVLTYSFTSGIPGYYAEADEEFIGGPQTLTSLQRGKVREALEIFESMLDIDFVEVPQAPGSLGNIIFGLTSLDDEVLGHAYFPSGPGKPGDIWLNKDLVDIQDMTAEGFLTIIHEMGHALGLTHSFQESETDFDNLPAATEHQRYTMMSYTRPTEAGRNETPMLYDLVELQLDYGANTSFNDDDTNITLPLNYDSFRIIWDGGGIDTLDLSNQTLAVVADIREGRYSSIGGLTENVAVAYNTLIENLEGGIGDDQLFGNSLNNIIFGGGGNDQLFGFSGQDLLRGGANNDRYVYTLGDDFDTIDEQTAGGRDVLVIRGFGAFNSFTNDLSFRIINGRDLDIQLTVDQGATQGGVVIKNQLWGGSRIETLRIQGASGGSIGPDIDLRSIFAYSTTELQRFQTTGFTSEFGTLAVPV